MRRTLSWLVAGALVAGLGGASMASSTDSFIPVQDPPTVTIGNLNEFYGVGGTSAVVNRILPSASLTTVRDGFTGGADSGDITRGETFSTDRADSASLVRVAPDGESSAPYYRQQVTVSTNGPTNTIERVGYCLINIEDDEVISDETFRWYDASSAAETNDLERNCGFSDENPKANGLPQNARAVISIIYTVGSGFEIQGDNEHELMENQTNTSDATWNGQVLTVNFAFKPSHALQKQNGNWIVRAAAQDQPTEISNGGPGQTTFDAQRSQIFWGNGTTNVQDELTLSNSADAGRDDWKFASVGYYGAIISERENVSFGTLRKDQERVVTPIQTGLYVANAESKLWIQATDFKTGGDGGSELGYVGDGDTLTEGNVLFKCSYGDDIGLGAKRVTNNAVELESNLVMSIDEADPEAPKDINTEGMACSLKYGGGAEDAADVYTNQVTLSIQDAGSTIAP